MVIITIIYCDNKMNNMNKIKYLSLLCLYILVTIAISHILINYKLELSHIKKSNIYTLILKIISPCLVLVSKYSFHLLY